MFKWKYIDEYIRYRNKKYKPVLAWMASTNSKLRATQNHKRTISLDEKQWSLLRKKYLKHFISDQLKVFFSNEGWRDPILELILSWFKSDWRSYLSDNISGTCALR